MPYAIKISLWVLKKEISRKEEKAKSKKIMKKFGFVVTK